MREKFYSHFLLEKKWQNFWMNKDFFSTNFDDYKEKKYILSMFPYPSGSGLHVGHIRIYTIADIIARLYRLRGYNVFFPIGWDSFGLPAEQYAIKTGNHPRDFTNINISNFKKQLFSFGFSFDWNKELKTSDENYYHWTQWIFCKMYENDLAEYKKIPVYWCDKLGTVLSNEEIKKKDDINYSVIGNHEVRKIDIKQWILKITSYSKKLLLGLNDLNWPTSIKNLQRNWIGKEEGLLINFSVFDSDISICIFLNQFDYIYGVSAIVLSLKNCLVRDLLNLIKNIKKKIHIISFIEKWEKNIPSSSSNHDAIFFELYCVNPVNNDKIPIFIANYLFDYDSSLIIPFLSKKDRFFCEKFFLRKIDILKRNNEIKDSPLFYINSYLINGINFSSDRNRALKIIEDYLEEKKMAKREERYHLRDWIFSRQRYWGEPIPIIHYFDKLKNKWEKKIDDELPLTLPLIENFKPDKENIFPLRKAKKWINYSNNGLIGFRDSNVMPQWAGSCWYYIAFLLSKADYFLPIYSSEARNIMKKWLPVDIYIGGQEHANLHLLYSRFWHKFLYDIGIVSCNEPFKKLICQGMILGRDGNKMSKSLGNVINPDDLLEKYGADAIRIYEVFVSPIEKTVNFDVNGVKSMRKWLERVYNISVLIKNGNIENHHNIEIEKSYDKMSKNVNAYYDKFKFNLVVSSFMIFINDCYNLAKKGIPLRYFLDFLELLNPIAPHISSEIRSWFSNIDYLSSEKMHISAL